MPLAQSLATFDKAVIHLEGWGMSTDDVLALTGRLNQSLPHIHWHAGEVAAPGALTLLLVDIAALTGGKGHAFWNALGPFQSMERARRAGEPALALCRGRVSELPALRDGVWITTHAESWESKLLTVARALAALEWNAQDGYRAMQGWRAVRTLARADLLAITASGTEAEEFPAMLREICAASLMHPTALVAAGVPARTYGRTLVQAGLQDITLQAAAPMTLDGAVSVDTLVGFAWPGANQPSGS